MKGRIFYSGLAISILLIGLSSCYLENASTDVDQAIIINNQSQVVLGEFGDGTYLRARIYDASTVQEMLDSSIITFPFSSEISYDPALLEEPIGTDIFYIGSPYYGGIAVVIIVDMLPGRKYRLLLEEVQYSASFIDDPYTAALTEEFEVPAGGNTTLALDMLYYSYC